VTRTTIAAVALAMLFPSAAGAAAKGVPSIIAEVAQRHRVPVNFAQAITTVETRHRCNLVGSHGELGPMQIKPSTAREVGVTGNLRDCRTGAEAGMRYLAKAIARYGAGCEGASAYNRGLYSRRTCSAYGRRVMAVLGRR
jgi:soluble lytic murein transglycosylase-like protein